MPKLLGDTAGAIGDTKHSMLTLAQFQGLYGSGWVLADGSSYPTSQYASVSGNTSIPDCRGYHLRAANDNGGSGTGANPDNTTLGNSQSDQFGSHNHGGGDHNHSANRSVDAVNASLQRIVTTGNGDSPSHHHGAADVLLINNAGTILSTQGGDETRPKSITVNVFIRIN